MRANGLDHTTTTTGTGALTLASVSGYPSFDDVFGATGTRWVDYTILDANDVPIEGGIGEIALATMVLTRTRVTWTWNGTTYDVAPSGGLSLASGTKRVICAPAANSIAVNHPPFRSTSLQDEGRGFLLPTGGANFNATHQRVGAALLYWPWNAPIDRAVARCAAAYTGGTVYFGVAFYELASDGIPGKRLALFDSWTTNPLQSTSVQVSNALSSPVLIPSGWYWFAWLATFTGGSGTPQYHASQIGQAPAGVVGASLTGGQRAAQIMINNSKTDLPDPCHTTGWSFDGILNIPLVLFR